jgi:hypothetical protein
MRSKAAHLVVIVAAAIGLFKAAADETQAQPAMRSANSSAEAVPDSPNYSEAMRRLLEAAQKLRDATGAMAEQPRGSERDSAIQQTNEALLETQRAMFDLPIDLRYAPASAPEYAQALDKLKQAAQKLKEAAHAIAAQPPSPNRGAAIKQTNHALLETQQAMTELLSQDAASATPGSSESR